MPANPRTGSTEFTNDYIMLGLAADIDERTSFFAKANVYTGGSATTDLFQRCLVLTVSWDTADDVIGLGADGAVGGGDDITGRSMPAEFLDCILMTTFMFMLKIFGLIGILLLVVWAFHGDMKPVEHFVRIHIL